MSPLEKQFSQSELEAIAAALGDTSEGLTGSEIGHILATLKTADPNPDMTKWKRLHNAFVERQNYSQNRRAILEFIRQAMKPERYAKCPERFEPMRANVNRALAFSGLAVDAAGQIYAVDRAQTLSEAQRRADELRADLTTRGVHPDVLRFCRAELVADNYFHAVLEATKSIADKLRVKSGLSEDGAKLVDASPKLQRSVKSITYLLPSHRPSVINPDHDSLRRALLRDAGPLLSWAAKSPS